MAKKRNFLQLLEDRWSQRKFVCVGLDPRMKLLPKRLRQANSKDLPDAVFAFNEAIIHATRDLVCAYKPNLAFYQGLEGNGANDVLAATISVIHEVAPNVPVILDAKYGDIAETNKMYAQYAFTVLKADAVTVHPYMGITDLKPFFDRADKGVFVVCRSSNPGSRTFQSSMTPSGERNVYESVAYQTKYASSSYRNGGLVAGAQDTRAIAAIRSQARDIPLLIPGIGAQGGDLEAAVQTGRDSRGKGFIVSSSRSIIHASSSDDFVEAARRETLALDRRIREILRG